jgi:hypothetical protein
MRIDKAHQRVIGRGGPTALAEPVLLRTAHGSATANGRSCPTAPSLRARRSGPRGRPATRHAGSPAARSTASPTTTTAQRRSRRPTSRSVRHGAGAPAPAARRSETSSGGRMTDALQPSPARPSLWLTLVSHPPRSSVSLIALSTSPLALLGARMRGASAYATPRVRRVAWRSCLSVRLSSGRVRQAVPQDCSFAEKQASPPALLSSSISGASRRRNSALLSSVSERDVSHPPTRVGLPPAQPEPGG